MPPPIDYERTDPYQFGGVLPSPPTFDAAAAVILPVPFDRTTSYVSGTRHGPRELLLEIHLAAVDDHHLRLERQHQLDVGIEKGADTRELLHFRREGVVAADANHARSRPEGIEHLRHGGDEGHDALDLGIW